MEFATSVGRSVISVALLALLAATGRSQGLGVGPGINWNDLVKEAPAAENGFVNFETPQVKPICVVTIHDGGLVHDLLLVCNTPDNSVEIYDANPPHRFIQRVPVGLGPVTVRYNEELSRFYTCNFAGDSVSVVRLELPTTPERDVQAVLERTEHVGDEPSDITFLGNGTLAIITLNSKSAITARSARDLSLIVPQYDLTLLDRFGLHVAVKQPRLMQALPDGRVFILNFMGDHKATPLQLYDLDLYSYDPSAVDILPMQGTGGMGTTNHSFAITRDGSRMFVVGTRAQNFAAVGVKAVSELKTGFLGSYVWSVDIIPGRLPVVHPEAAAGVLPAPRFPSINLNRDYSEDTVGTNGEMVLGEVDRDHALSQPTDVLLVETDDSFAEIQKLFITAYHSDKVAVLHPDRSVYGGWRINQIRIPVLDDSQGYGVSGPRGLAFSRNAVDPATPDRPGLVFCANRLDNTVSVINPHTETLIHQFSLQNDPTPVAIRKGRKFLYSAAQFSGNGMVSCASCHVDGRTDGLSWNLGGLEIGPSIPSWFHDGNGQTVDSMPNFPADKGRMATQTLQGLVNSQVNRNMQVLFSNAPYHWRGDKRRLNDFNEAFVNLQGMDPLPSDPPDEGPKGISDEDMNDYAAFMNTIVHPPNPEQWYDRTITGSLGEDPNNPKEGKGALLGLKIYHVQPILSVGPRSCVQCHTLPDGSSNTSSLTALIPPTVGNIFNQLHPIETAATRNLFQREALLHRDFKIPEISRMILTGNSGLLHTGDFLPGLNLSINDFVGNVFVSQMPGPNLEDRIRQVEAVIAFMRQFDTGIAPLVGYSYTYLPGSPVNRALLGILEGQVAQANIGLGIYTRSRGVERGYYYDLTVPRPRYREEGTSNFISAAELDRLAATDDGVVILQSTQVGNERRWANLKGVATPIKQKNLRPENVTLEPMAPSVAWVDITKFTGNLEPTPPAISLMSLRALQDAVIGPEFGVESLRHEPPRRFRVSGTNIRHGARLAIAMRSDGITDPDVIVTAPGTIIADPTSIAIIWMPLFPTGFVSHGMPVWETTAEADATITMALLNGGLWAPGVAEILLGTVPPTNPLDPETWNSFLVGVLNEDNTLNRDLEWQVLRVQDGR